MDDEEEINFQDVEHVFHTFLRQHCENEVMEILNAENELEHYSLHVNALELFDMNMLISTQLLKVPLQLLPVFERAAFKVQRECLRDLVPNESQYSMSVKTNCHVRLSNLPICPELTRNRLPQSEDVGTFLAFSGTVIRCSIAKLLEYERQFMCNKCRHVFTVEVEFEQNYNLPTPTSCPSSDGCNSYKFTEMKDGKGPSKCKDYQELKVQEQVQRLDVGTIPRSIVVIMEDDLVDKCKPGDDVTVSGVVLRRWQNVYQDTRCQIEIVIKASDVIISNDQRSSVTMTDQHRREFEYFWEENRHSPLKGRNEILSGFCPQVYGLYVVKLAVTIALIGGVQRVKESGTRIRGESHLLLVGDPGTGKSQFLKYAAKVMPRSVLTTGIGSTSAGLTVTAVKDSGEWQLEAGALVLADGGICCIDEFNSIREHDRTSIHEAMEQQTISVAKAGLVCKLNTRTTILAATNPKGKYDRHESVSVNVALASPLLSRFDVVLVLIDKQNEDWDRIISNFILRRRRPTASIDFWSLDRMQAYFSFVKRKAPTLSEDSMRILRAYYQGQRSADLRNAARTTIRLLESMIRISEAHARLMFREEVTIQDAVMAVCIMECSMQNTALLQGLMNPLHTSFPKDADAEYIDQATVILNKLKLNDILEKVLEYERERKVALLRSRRNNSSDHDGSHNSSTNESHQKSFRSVSNDSQIKTNNQPLGSHKGDCDGESMDTANNQRPHSTVNAFQKSFTAANSDSLTPLTNQEQKHERITTPPANQKSLLDMFQLEEEDKEDDPIWQHFISTQTSSSSTKTKVDKKTTSAEEGGLVVPKKKKPFFRNTQSASASGKSKSGDNNNNEKRLMDDEHGTNSSKQNTSFKMTNPAKTKNVLKTKNTFFTGENLDDEAIDDFFRLEEDISKQTKKMAETKNGSHITESGNLITETGNHRKTSSFKTNTKIEKTFRVPFQMRAQPAPSDKCNDDKNNGNSDKSELHQRPSKSNVKCVENKASPIVDSPPDLADFDKDSLWDDDILNSSLSSTKTNKNKNNLNSTSQKDDAYADTLLITTQERITPDFTAFPPRKRNKPFELKEFDIVNTTTESQLAARVMDVQTPTTRNNNELENTGPKGKLKRFKFRKK